MNAMSDKAFIDTNIFVYAFLDSEGLDNHCKHLKAVTLLQTFHSSDLAVISTQVLSEYYSVLLKHKIDDSSIQSSVRQLAAATTVTSVSAQTVFSSHALRNRYHFSHWDALIVASAVEQGCTKLYSEDLQHHQQIDNRLRIINPFLVVP